MDSPFAYGWFYGWRDYIDDPRRIFCTVRNWYRNFRYSLKWVKWFFQRGSRGWADCDWWSMDYYLVQITIPMLKKLKTDSRGCPCPIDKSYEECEKEWHAKLDEMIEAFEAAKRVLDDDYYKQVSGDSLEAIENATRADIKEWMRLNEADQKLFRKKVKVFIKHFFSLWD